MAMIMGPFYPQILTASPMVTGAVGDPYSFTFATVPGTGSPPFTWTALSGLDPGLSLNSATGAVSGTPVNQGTKTVVIQVKGVDGLPAQKSYSFTVGAALSITTTSPLPGGAQGTAYSDTLAAAGGIAPYSNWTVISGSLDPGLSLNAATGVISGTPTTPNTYNPVIQVKDFIGVTVSKAFSLTISATPQAATPTFSPVAGTYTGTQLVTISCSTPSSTIYYTTNGSTPTTSSTVYTSPVSVATSLTLKAIATATGYLQSNVGSAAYVINSGTASLVIQQPSALPVAQQGFQYQLALPVLLGVAPYTGTLVSQTGSNAGVWSLSSTGLLAGTPTVAGTDTITVSFTDAATNTTGNVAFTLVTNGVGGTLTSLVGSTYTAPAATAGGSYALPLNSLVSGGMPPYVWQAGSGSVTGGSGTAWQSQVSFNSLQGCPASAATGTDSIAMVCTDSLGATVAITISVPINSTLTFQGIIPGTTSGQQLPLAMAGNVYGTTNFGYPLRAAGGTGTGYTFSSVSGAPPGLGITGKIITGTPSTAGSYNWTIQVTDSGSNTAQYTFSVLVQPSLNTTPPSWCTGSGKAFYVSSGQIYDWSGAPYRGRGLNINHADQNWHSGSPSSPNGLANTRASIARLFLSQSYFSWSTMNGYINDVTQYACVAVATIGTFAGNFGTTNGQNSYGQNGNNQFADALYQIYQGASVLSTYNDTIFLDLCNEFGSYGSAAMQHQWSAVGLSASNTPNISVASVSGTTITLASSVTGTNPFANSCVGVLQGGTGGQQFVYITGTGGTSGNFTVTSYSSLTASTGGTLVAGGIGVARAIGLTCPIFIDSGSDPYIASQLPQFQAIIASDPLGNVILDVHHYNNTVASAGAITNITKANPGTITFSFPNVFMGNQNGNPMDEGSGAVTTFWNQFYVYGVQGMTQINGTTFTANPTTGTGGSYTQNSNTNTTGFGTYTGGGWIVPWQNGHIYYQYQAANCAALMNQGVAIMVGEFADCTPPLQQTTSNWCPGGYKATAYENNQLGWIYWAMDDNGETYPSQGAFCITQLNAVGVYSKPTDLVWHGADIVLHPTYGITALSTPASALI